MYIELPEGFAEHIKPMIREIFKPDSLARGLMNARRPDSSIYSEVSQAGITERFKRNTAGAVRRMVTADFQQAREIREA